MIFNYYILNNKQLIFQQFIIEKKNNYIYVDICEASKNIIKIPLYDNIIGLYYEPIYFPLKLEIINNFVFNVYNLFLNNAKNKNQEFNFFYLIKKLIKKNYNLNYCFIHSKYVNYINKQYNELHLIKNNIELLWNKYLLLKINSYLNILDNILFLNTINVNTHDCNIYKYINNLDNYINNTLSTTTNCNAMNYNKFINLNLNNNKYLNDNNIKTNNLTHIKNKYDIIKNLNINYHFIYYIFEKILDNTNINITINYFYNNNSLNNDFHINNKNICDLYILSNRDYDSNYFNYISLKYDNVTEITNIINKLLEKISYPLKNNKYMINNIFNYLIYFSLVNRTIIVENNIINNIKNNKLKYVYLNLFNILYNLINDNYINLISNKIYYTNNLYENIISIYIFSYYDENMLSVNYFRNIIGSVKLEIIKSNYLKILNILSLIDIINNNNNDYTIYYIELFRYYYVKKLEIDKTKLNAIIFSNCYDVNKTTDIKRIINNPFYILTLLDSKELFAEWVNIIKNKLIYILDIDINILTEENFTCIGYFLYYLFNIKIQEYEDINYYNLLLLCKNNRNLFIEKNKIKIKIKKKYLNLQCIVNLGGLIKNINYI